ncbi:MAG: exodeoxyribonuclease VII small subunit [Oscillospiraceae bacterium]|nr:exodeoxyribonuclease VII small subunit [Oscillospiraceae bacterium]
MKFEEGMQQLLAITAKLEEGGLSLEEAVKLYGEGAKLAAECKKELDQAKLTVSEYGQTKPGEA